jgi:acetyl-CoA carboxylase biotin carboxyl carrier protein
VRTRNTEEGRIEVRSPVVGMWRNAPPRGVVVTGSMPIGELEVLGVLHRLVVPTGVRGEVVEVRDRQGRARVPVGYEELLLVLDPEAVGSLESASTASPGAAGEPVHEGALVFAAPSAGRYYGRPSPDKAPFVSVGDVIEHGQTVCLIEVMKTFNRVAYHAASGRPLPSPARVVAIRPSDGDDVEAGEPLIEVEAAS